MKNNLNQPLIFLLLVIIITSGCATHQSLTKEEKKLLEELRGMLDITISEIEEEKTDPASPTKDYSMVLMEKREYVKLMESGIIPYDPELISKFTDDTKELQVNIRNPVGRVLETDISFGLGKYDVSDISDKGKEVLTRFAREIVDVLVMKQRAIFPEKTLLITITTIGYADEVAPGPDLRKRLTDILADPLPEDPVEERMFLNRELSRLRAHSINKFITQTLRDMVNSPRITIGEPVSKGMGEAFPYPPDTIEPPYTSEDKRRRVCKVHGKVFREQ